MKTLQERIQSSLLRNPSATDAVLAKNLRTTVSTVREVRAGTSSEGASSPSSPPVVISQKGINLEGKNISMKRPAESVASYFSRLPKGQGFHLSDLSRSWGVGEGTIKRHAKEKNCLRYVDLGNGDWQPMVMHPETALKLT